MTRDKVRPNFDGSAAYATRNDAAVRPPERLVYRAGAIPSLEAPQSRSEGLRLASEG
jgi:hypothetical protein